jgi:IS30 family transposase
MAVKPRVERKLILGTAARAAVLEQFAAGLSPEQAARTLKRMHAVNPDMHFSHETIFQAIYAMSRADLRCEVGAQPKTTQNARLEMPPRSLPAQLRLRDILAQHLQPCCTSNSKPPTKRANYPSNRVSFAT